MKTSWMTSSLAMLLTLAVLAVASAKDGDRPALDAHAARALASGHTWQSKKVGGATGHAWWTWQSDGSVCLRMDGPTSNCFDKGTWRLNGDRLCWQLEWFGEALGHKSACIRVSDQGQGRYLGVDEAGSTVLDFSVLK